ncbi:hypothetical protein PMAYCL1PPCAC_23672 [Pristionchus mayeri]|uniref:Uncharacterized protein n=1 Tax=Pristionchus mayeri TaxID=1317129 RepID=A0AAN5CZQ0_9BILA|nr:hypothetical protein PMAYCL1PPCAC_23672 [Pristionchus mayeri]
MRVVLLYFLPSLILSLPRDNVFSLYDNSSRAVVTYKTDCWEKDLPKTYLASVNLVCAVQFIQNVAGIWERATLGAVVVPKDKYKEAYFPCHCAENIVVICCPGGYCDMNMGMMKMALCGMQHLYLHDLVDDNLLAEHLRDKFEETLFFEEVHGGFDDLSYLHGEDQYGNGYLEYNRERVVLNPIYQRYSI